MNGAGMRRTLAMFLAILGPGSCGLGRVDAADPPADAMDFMVSVLPGQPVVLNVPGPGETRVRCVAVAVGQPGHVSSDLSLDIRLESGGREPAWRRSLRLSAGDSDLAEIVQQAAGEPMRISVAFDGPAARGRPGQEGIRIAVRVSDLGRKEGRGSPAPVDPDSGETVDFEAEPNDTPESANPLVLGRTVYGLADDRPYWIPEQAPTGEASGPGIDWFRFRFEGQTPRLAFFALDYVDRDVPPDVRVYRQEDGRMVEYARGIDPQSLQRERPPRPGANKFTTRVLEPGTYFLRVDACQPDYQLRTKLFDAPPYIRPEDASAATPGTVAMAARKAVRTAMDYQLLAGDSWHANTPRKGHPTDRVANFHHETSTCVACHPTHFTTQSAMAAVKAGYSIEQPFAMQFLIDRLANNPVPFHGHPDAAWARMIPAPANVLGRLSTIVQDHEDRIAGPHRDHLHRAIAEFLKLYYDGRTELPSDETNGNNPVSRYKVATDSWRQLDRVARRTGDDRYARTRDLVAGLLPTGKPANTRDLAAQTIGLCVIDPRRRHLGPLIDANVRRLLEIQRPNGHWSVKFDANYPITEMQTGESLYALSLAGRGPDDPDMRRGILALLSRQQSFGGWFDVNPYEQFRTPFRETQWALMALSTLYPIPRPPSAGWNGPLGPQPTRLRRDEPSAIIRDLERIWDNPSPDLLRDVLGQLDHPSPLVRYAACRTLSRVGSDAAGIDGLSRRLGDETKVVRRAAAEALRSIGNRLNASSPPAASEAQRRLVDRLQTALRSPDDRTRRGATRLFAAHFRELSQEQTLADVLLERLDDPDPVVAMQAIKGLWRWWYWQAEPSLRGRIEDRLITALAQPRHPWVRRNLIEALYIIGDDNIRYLDNNWIPSLARAEDRRRATEGQHATVNRLGTKYARALETGNALQREGILRAMSEFFERPVLGGRIGNDLEPMLLHDPVSREVKSALIARSTDPDPTIRRLALQALVTIRGDRSPELAGAVLRRLGDTDESVRTWAANMSREFPLRVASGSRDAETIALVEELLAQPIPAARAAGLEIVGRLGPATVPDGGDPLTARLLRLLDDPDAPVRSAAFEALRGFPALWPDGAVRRSVSKALGDSDVRVRVAAVVLALEPNFKVREASLRRALDDSPPAARILLLERIGAEARLRRDLRLLGVVSAGLLAPESGLREKALQLIQKHGELIADAAIEGALRELARDDSAGQRHREVARSLLASRGRSSGGNATADRLDIAYFQARVLPIFNRMGDDGQSCIGCHRSHTILRMVAPDKGGGWSVEAVRANYRSTLRVVNLAHPSESLLLGKPTWEAAEEAEAQNDPRRKAHAGGVRFEAGSREYQTLLDWLNGARLPVGDGSAAR
jgi:HEAT repeat protein